MSRLPTKHILLVAGLIVAFALVVMGGRTPSRAQAATCGSHSTQAEAQRAMDTRDADGDGRYCESLPCPCTGPGGGSSAPSAPQRATQRQACTKPRTVVRLVFSRARYPNIHAHARAAVRRGWPRILVVNRSGKDGRRDRLLRNISTRSGSDRDEYPPAIGRGKGAHLVRGADPRGWMADVAYVPSSENRSHGSVMGHKLRPYCDGTRFRYIFR